MVAAFLQSLSGRLQVALVEDPNLKSKSKIKNRASPCRPGPHLDQRADWAHHGDKVAHGGIASA